MESIPMAFLRKPERATQEILALFESARIPVVLIDRDIELKETNLRHDFVGIDNVSAGRASRAPIWRKSPIGRSASASPMPICRPGASSCPRRSSCANPRGADC